MAFAFWVSIDTKAGVTALMDAWSRGLHRVWSNQLHCGVASSELCKT